jgi:hypothetical protein
MMPEDGLRAGRVSVGEADQVEDERVEHSVQQRVLVQQDADKK